MPRQRRTSLRILLTAVLSTTTLALASPRRATAQKVDQALYGALQWTNIGINRGGRSIAVAGSDQRPLEYYFGATGGGLWKTTDGGTTWRPVTDHQLGSSSVGAVAVCAADPDVVYIGMGETELRGNVMQGDGVYRSTDGGKTWQHLGLDETRTISKIRISPTDCNTAWVGAFGKLSASSPERGVYKTTDGGKTWRKTLFRSPDAGVIDLRVDPNDPNTLYAATWQAWRKSWGMSSGGDDSALYKSTDGGETWTDITANLGLKPATPIGKIGIAVSRAQEGRLWVLVEHEPMGGVYRSDDGGATWQRTNDERKLRQRAFYYSRIYADPQNPDVVYALNTGMYKSTDAGKTFNPIRTPHGDNHDLWIAPSNPMRMIEANDGGANVSVNGGQTWTEQDYPTAQFYRVVTTQHQPYHVCGAQQDNTTACMPSKDWDHLYAGGGQGDYFYSVAGGESGYIAASPTDPNLFYAGSYGGALDRFDHATGITRPVNVWPENPMGESAEDITERSQWTYPIVYGHFDPYPLYVGTQKVWMTTNGGQSWTALSGDLTRHAPETMGPSGGPITKDQTGVETYATVFTIAPSYKDPDVIWAGSDDGYVQVTRNASAPTPTWTNVTPPDAPDFIRINTIEASPTTPGKAYVAGIRYLVDDDRTPYVWKTTDYGKTWTKIVNGIAPGDFVRTVREDPVRPGLLYAASEHRVYVSWDDGANWQPLAMNLPVTQVADLKVRDGDLVIATHGRGFWIMYGGANMLRQVQPAMATQDVILFDPQDPVRGFDRELTLDYYLRQEAHQVKFEFLDADGTVIETFTSSAKEEGNEGGGGGSEDEDAPSFGRRGSSGPSLKAGSHRFTWNMRYPGWTDFPGRIFWAARPSGPEALPGRYTVRLTVDGRTATQDFDIEMNPRAAKEGVTLADLREQFRFAMQIRDRVSAANEAILKIRAIKKAVTERLGQSDDQGLHTMGAALDQKLGAVEREIYQVKNQSNQDPLNYPIKLNNKLAALESLVQGSDNRPTDQAYTVFKVLSGELDTQLQNLDTVVSQDLGRFNDTLRRLDMKPIDPGKLVAQ